MDGWRASLRAGETIGKRATESCWLFFFLFLYFIRFPLVFFLALLSFLH